MNTKASRTKLLKTGVELKRSKAFVNQLKAARESLKKTASSNTKASKGDLYNQAMIYRKWSGNGFTKEMTKANAMKSMKNEEFVKD